MNIELKQPVVYVTRDIERALGMGPTGNYFVISNDTPYGREIESKYRGNVFLMKGPVVDTYDLLCMTEVENIVADKGAAIVVFQNTPRIERLATEKGWRLLNPSANLAKKVEEKISQTKWLEGEPLLFSQTAILKEISFQNKKFVIQFNHSHTGGGTCVIDSAKKLQELQDLYPNRECRFADFIEGPVLTVNAVTAVENNVIVSNPSYQITGLEPFTDVQFSTIGNDWSLPKKENYKEITENTIEIAKKIGKRLAEEGWKGLFGIDVIHDTSNGETYLLEINARQPASTVFESTLQKHADKDAYTIFEAHIAALLNQPIAGDIARNISGAQIVKRVTNQTYDVDVAALRAKNLMVIEYENTEHNKELFRIQSTAGIMESHGKLNALGESISSCIK